MTPKEVVEAWVSAFNKADLDTLINLYDDEAVNHQVAYQAFKGKLEIRAMFESEFARAEMTCIIEQILTDGDWAILEWKDPLGLRGCGFFEVKHNKIVFQRGYFDQLSFYRQQGIPLPTE